MRMSEKEVAEEIRRLRGGGKALMFEEDGNYTTINYNEEENWLEYGDIANAGFMIGGSIEYDLDESLDHNLKELHDEWKKNEFNKI